MDTVRTVGFVMVTIGMTACGGNFVSPGDVVGAYELVSPAPSGAPVILILHPDQTFSFVGAPAAIIHTAQPGVVSIGDWNTASLDGDGFCIDMFGERSATAAGPAFSCDLIIDDADSQTRLWMPAADGESHAFTFARTATAAAIAVQMEAGATAAVKP